MPIPAALAWLAAGLLLCCAEAVVPGVYLIWLGFGAVLTGLMLLGAEAPFLVQVLLFAALAGLSVVLGRAVERRRAAPDPNRQGADLIGEACRAVAFDGPDGRVRFRDSEWAARCASGAPLPGAALRIVGVDGNRLLVAEDTPR